MWIAGLVSGLLGIGSGVLKVIAMDGAMRTPDESEFGDEQFHDRGDRCGVGRYLPPGAGDVDPQIAAPVASAFLLVL